MKKKLNCVLLIDDDEPTNYLNELVIHEADVAESVVSVQSAKQGLELLVHNENASHLNPELIFLDINMPAMNGWEFIDQYKRMSHFQNRKVIVMLTASINQDDQTRARSISEISDFMNKPLSQMLLEDLIKKHFPALI